MDLLCEKCWYNEYDEETDECFCSLVLDEDEYVRFCEEQNKTCRYFRRGDHRSPLFFYAFFLTNTLYGYIIKIPREGIRSDLMETNDNNKGCCCCHGKTKHRTDEEQKALINRLNRIEGQIRGIKRMLEEDAYCTDIITQVAAANAALNSFNKELLSTHIKTCVTDDIKAGKTETVDDLLKTLQKLMK